MDSRQLIDYQPPAMKEVREIKAVEYTEQPEFDLLWSAANFIMCNQFIVDASEYGLSRWENILEIMPKAADSLNMRKTRVLIRLNEVLPYTIRFLELLLKDMFGESRYLIELNHNQYHLHVKLISVAVAVCLEIFALLERITPMNLTLGITSESCITGTNGCHISVIPIMRGTNRREVIEPNLSVKTSVQAQINVNTGNMIHTYHKTVIDVQVMPPTPHMTAKIHGLSAAAELYRKINISEGSR